MMLNDTRTVIRDVEDNFERIVGEMAVSPFRTIMKKYELSFQNSRHCLQKIQELDAGQEDRKTQEIPILPSKMIHRIDDMDQISKKVQEEFSRMKFKISDFITNTIPISAVSTVIGRLGPSRDLNLKDSNKNEKMRTSIDYQKIENNILSILQTLGIATTFKRAKSLPRSTKTKRNKSKNQVILQNKKLIKFESQSRKSLKGIFGIDKFKRRATHHSIKKGAGNKNNLERAKSFQKISLRKKTSKLMSYQTIECVSRRSKPEKKTKMNSIFAADQRFSDFPNKREKIPDYYLTQDQQDIYKYPTSKRKRAGSPLSKIFKRKEASFTKSKHRIGEGDSLGRLTSLRSLHTKDNVRGRGYDDKSEYFTRGIRDRDSNNNSRSIKGSSKRQKNRKVRTRTRLRTGTQGRQQLVSGRVVGLRSASSHSRDKKTGSRGSRIGGLVSWQIMRSLRNGSPK